jgi:hypothetical protein
MPYADVPKRVDDMLVEQNMVRNDQLGNDLF